ncbi:MAG: hypothetical protein AAB489_00145 [Patescibacteria group bacterium]
MGSEISSDASLAVSKHGVYQHAETGEGVGPDLWRAIKTLRDAHGNS